MVFRWLRLVATATALLAAAGFVEIPTADAGNPGCQHCTAHHGGHAGRCSHCGGALHAAANVALPHAVTHPMRQNDLFYNYYTNPNMCDPSGAQLYVSPVPVPQQVGHTYITYQPLMPHEFLYKHHRSYYRFDGMRPVNRTSVFWW